MIETIRYPEYDLTFRRGSGNVTAEEIRDSVIEGQAGDPYLRLDIWDFSNATVESMDIEALGALLWEVQEVVVPRGGERTALVASQADAQAMASLFGRLAAFTELPVELHTFADLPSAVSWLFRSRWRDVMQALHP